MNAVQKATFSVRIDKSMKQAFEELCNSIGISMTYAVNAMIRQAIHQQGINFSLRDENGFLPDEAAELKRRVDDVNNGIVERHSLKE